MWSYVFHNVKYEKYTITETHKAGILYTSNQLQSTNKSNMIDLSPDLYIHIPLIHIHTITSARACIMYSEEAIV